jgi:integrase
VGAWLEKFTAVETSPRTSVNAGKNRPYSPDTLETYKSYYDAHLKGNPFLELKMDEAEKEYALQFINRLSVKKKKTGEPLGGTRTFAGIIFVRMAFRSYQDDHDRWFNPFRSLHPPRPNAAAGDALTEDEVIKLFRPDILKETMDLAVCAAMFLSGMRRSEIFALKPECLDWHTPKITVKNAWQRFNRKDRILGPPKGKRKRDVPFDPVLQNAVRKLWEENGQHEFVFSFKNGKTPWPS